jgi:carbon monoxide dehydrogenase subunit G
MPIQFEHTIEVKADPKTVFALLDDLPKTPKWLPPCTALVKLSPGPNAVGDKLNYTYKQGSRSNTMNGEIMTRVENSQLVCRYFDSMMEVLVDLRVIPASAGTTMTHIITITPKTFIGKLMSPLIRIGVPKQTRSAMENLRRMVENG